MVLLCEIPQFTAEEKQTRTLTSILRDFLCQVRTDSNAANQKQPIQHGNFYFVP